VSLKGQLSGNFPSNIWKLSPRECSMGKISKFCATDKRVIASGQAAPALPIAET
jgi:hypothetical protein